jgi:hypothetical protein
MWRREAVLSVRAVDIKGIGATPPPARVLQGTSLVLGPALNAAATFFWSDEGRHGVTGGTLVALSSVVWLPGLLGLWEAVRTSRPVVGSLGGALAVVGAFGGITFGLQGFYEGVYGLSKQQSLDALAAHPVAAQLALWLPGPVFPIALAVLGLALAWTRVVPRWTAALLAAAGFLWPVSRIPRVEALAHVADLTLLVPSVVLGVLLLTGLRRSGAAESSVAPVVR